MDKLYGWFVYEQCIAAELGLIDDQFEVLGAVYLESCCYRFGRKLVERQRSGGEAEMECSHVLSDCTLRQSLASSCSDTVPPGSSSTPCTAGK